MIPRSKWVTLIPSIAEPPNSRPEGDHEDRGEGPASSSPSNGCRPTRRWTRRSPLLCLTGALAIGGEVVARFDLSSAGFAGHRPAVSRLGTSSSTKTPMVAARSVHGQHESKLKPNVVNSSSIWPE